MKFWPWKRKPAQVEHKKNGITDQVVELERFGCKICGKLHNQAKTIILGDTMLLVCRACLSFPRFRERINEDYERYLEQMRKTRETWREASLAMRKQ